MNRVRGDGGKFFKGNKLPNQKLGDFKIGSKRNQKASASSQNHEEEEEDGEENETINFAFIG